MKFSSLFLVFSLVISSASQICGADETIDTYLKTHQLDEGAILKLKDPKIYTPSGYDSGWGSDFGIGQTQNAVELFLNSAADDYGKLEFSMTVDLKLTYRDAQNKVVQNDQGKDTSRLSLRVDYSKEGTFKNRDAHVFNNAHQVYVEVADVTIQGADTTSLTNVVFLRSSISVERYYDMKNSKVKNLQHTYHTSDNELEISWDDKKGAVWYDVEWAFVENYSYNRGNMQRKPMSRVSFNFDDNSQRIRTKSHQYRLPVVYQEGYLVYRVRPVAKGGSNFNRKVYGPWSLKEKGKVSSAGTHAYTVSAGQVHEQDKMNWQYNATYDESGNKQALVKYYDGLHYRRQQVKQLHTVQDVLVSEQMYDFFGRKAVDVLPAPTARKNSHPNLKYYEAFNQNRQGQPYNKKNFDNLSGCNPSAEPMSKSSGAARYYSSNNSSQSLFKEHLPQSEGYPFKQTQYMPDKSNDVRRVGKPGKAYQIGQGHTIQKFSGTPGQSELDRLFGSEVGYARHYRKRIISNENNQLRVQYLNPAGNPIATALAGDKPTALKKLPSDQMESKTIDEKILENRQTIRGNSIEASKKILVATEGSHYSFKYTVTPGTFERELCDGESICFDGIYDLQIRLTNECGDVVEDTVMQIGSLQDIDEQCNANQPVTVSFSSGPLSIGSYFLSKKLVMNEQALDEYLAIYEEKECIQRTWDTILKEKKEETDTIPCNLDCGQAGAIDSTYEYTTDDGKTHTANLSAAQVKRMKQQRNNLCGSGGNSCQNALDALLRDVSPGGQYARYYDTTDNETDPSVYPVSVLKENNNLPGESSNWRHPDGEYRDEDGSKSYIKINQLSGRDAIANERDITYHRGDSVIEPENLRRVEDFVHFWKDSWAEALVAFHPEYGYYLYCKQNPASNNYDRQLLGTRDYKGALDSGYVSANGATMLLDRDPFFSKHTSLKDTMRKRLNNFKTIQGTTFSLEEIVVAAQNGCAAAECNTGNFNTSEFKQCISNHKPLFKVKDANTQRLEWSTYRSIYLSVKRKITEPRRHAFAIKKGYYNGSIGKESGSGGIASEVSRIINKYNVSAGNQQRIMNSMSCYSCYSEKDLRFPDGDDIYRYIDGLEATHDTRVQVDQMEKYVDNKLKNNCDKCPVETDMETLLNGLVTNGTITGTQDATGAVASCDFKKQMNSPGNKYFSWSASTSDGELTGRLMNEQNVLLTIRLYDSSKTTVKWDNILMFTCLQHTTNTNHFSNTQTRNFKVRAVTEDREVHWLEGVSSSIDLTECDIEKFCTKSPIADDLKAVFNKAFGLFPVMRELLVDRGYQQLADQKMPLYQNTDLIGEAVISLTQALKQQHTSPTRPGDYYWKAAQLSRDKQSLEAGIYGPKQNTKCLFSFEMLDDSRQFGDPFIVDKVHLNHPAIDQSNCNATAFVLEVRPFGLALNNSMAAPTISAVSGPSNPLSMLQFGEPYFIKVTNDCYQLGECCPESNCPDIAKNGGFNKRTSGFSSELPYSSEQKGDNYYTILPKDYLDEGSDIDYNNIPGRDIQNLNNLPFNRDDLNLDLPNQNIQDTASTDEGQLDTETLQDIGGNVSNKAISGFAGQNKQAAADTARPDTGRTPGILQNIGQMPVNKQDLVISQKISQNRFSVQDLNLKVSNSTLLKQTLSLGLQKEETEMSKYQVRQLNSAVPMTLSPRVFNKYLLFKVSGNQKRDVWKQSLDLKKDNTYSFTVKVRSMASGEKQGRIRKPLEQFSLKAGNQDKQLSPDGEKGQWKVLKGYFDAGQGGQRSIALQFTSASQYQRVKQQKWAIDDVVVKPQSCPQPGCCPPIFPEMPENTTENPCKAMKEVVAEGNAKREFEEFLEDTLTSIEAGYRNTIMKPEESLIMTYNDNYYKYTLFYYDQSGKMVKSVPPKGFNPLSDSKVEQVRNNRNGSGNNPVYPNHKRISRYRYNSYNELVYKQTPDEGVTEYWYDELGRQVARQTAAQEKEGNVYTYILYDELNRKVETGEVNATNTLSHSLARDYNTFENWVRGATKNEVIHKYYDEPLNATTDGYFPDGQQNLRKRIATIVYEEKWDGNASTYDFATHFSYDAHGNVNFLVKENTRFPQPHQVKKVDYEFDVISGDIQKITYQPGEKDQFIHKYKYDADKRLSRVLTSRHGLHWEEEARYYYYPHGKIARMELGEEKVQGVDFAYTLQGWLKGINGSELSPGSDAGGDGAERSLFSNVARDAVSMVVDYHSVDYKSIGGNNFFTSHLSGTLKNSSPGLYNSNVRQMVVSHAAFDNREGLALAYRYDQKGRLVESSSFYKNNNTWNTTSDYESSFSYDANGNITSITRQGDNGLMDQLRYNYRQGNNRLDHVADQVGDGSYPNDVDDQQSGNYSYDAQGRLKQDLAEDLQNITWSRNDRISSVVKQGLGSIYNYYDGTGYRVMKDYNLTDNDKDKLVRYVRGANNEILARYTYDYSEDSIYLTEQYIHGRARIGTYTPDTTMASVDPHRITQYRGNKQYAIGNHLDNVMATVSDRKIPDTTAASNNRYLPDVVSATGYYPYGSQMPGRKLNTSAYGHGFQGKEKDDELKGEGNSYYFKERMYDPRLGRWLSVDPKAKKFPGQSPYLAMSGNPISRADQTGGEDQDKCTMDMQIAIAYDREMQRAKQSSQNTVSGYSGDAYAVATDNKIFAYKEIGKSDINKLANISPTFDDFGDAIYDDLPSKKIRIKTVRYKTDKGQMKQYSTVSVYADNPTGKGGMWMPVSATPKVQQMRLKQKMYKKKFVPQTYKEGVIETAAQHEIREFKQDIEVGKKITQNPGAAIGAIQAHFRGRSFESMKRDIKMGDAIWNLVSGANAVENPSTIGNTGPSGNPKRTKDYQPSNVKFKNYR